MYIGMVVSREGFPLAFEISDGNRSDVTTMEEKYGCAKRVWVMDRGMISEENLEFLREFGRSLPGSGGQVLRGSRGEPRDFCPLPI